MRLKNIVVYKSWEHLEAVGILPGQRMIIGARKPPSMTVPLAPANRRAGDIDTRQIIRSGCPGYSSDRSSDLVRGTKRHTSSSGLTLGSLDLNRQEWSTSAN